MVLRHGWDGSNFSTNCKLSFCCGHCKKFVSHHLIQKYIAHLKYNWYILVSIMKFMSHLKMNRISERIPKLKLLMHELDIAHLKMHTAKTFLLALFASFRYEKRISRHGEMGECSVRFHIALHVLSLLLFLFFIPLQMFSSFAPLFAIIFMCLFHRTVAVFSGCHCRCRCRFSILFSTLVSVSFLRPKLNPLRLSVASTGCRHCCIHAHSSSCYMYAKNVCAFWPTNANTRTDSERNSRLSIFGSERTNGEANEKIKHKNFSKKAAAHRSAWLK